MSWSKMTQGERNQQVATAMGWTHTPRFPGDVSGYWNLPGGARYITEELPDFIGSLDAAKRFEDEIERRGLQNEYVEALHQLLVGTLCVAHQDIWWSFVRATPEQRCAAAYRAMLDSKDSS